MPDPFDVELATAIDGSSVRYINGTDLPDTDLEPHIRQVAAQLSEWVLGSQNRSRRKGILNRDEYVVPDNPLHQMFIARQAVATDDIVGGAADVIEGLMFQKVQWEGENTDDADVFNQISTDVDLDAFLRAASRELFTHSQVVVTSWWERKTYTVRGRNPIPHDQKPLPPVADPLTGVTPKPEPPKKGVKRKKQYRVFAPTQLTILDSLRVIPVGNRLWGGDQLAWHGTAEEIEIWDAGLDSPSAGDPTMQQLIIGKYTPDRQEATELSGLGVDPSRLLLLNPMRVWRHTLTRPSYAKWPDIRLRSVFPLLDLRRQLMDADRVHLIGAANYILLVRKGAKEEPPHQAELESLRRNFDVLAKLPIIISDHRLEIDIITPSQDYTLNQEKYEVLDARIISRMFGAITLSGTGQRNESTLTVARMVARLLESRRHMLKRSMEANFARRIIDANPDVDWEDEPNLAFTPRRVQLDADQEISQMILALRQQKEISRESILEYVGLDEAVEANRRIVEAQLYDDIFETAIPFNSPMNNAGGLPPGAFGATGGRPTGGGGNKPAGNSGATTGKNSSGGSSKPSSGAKGK
jgi:hypothetical protein